MTLAELQQALHEVTSAAVLVSPQVIERVIQQVRHLSTLPWDVPHRKTHVVDRLDLFRHIEQDDLELSPEYLLPATVILLVRPSNEQLANENNETLKGLYWRRLFHASVHLQLEQRWKEGKLTLEDVRSRIEEIGQTEFAEIRQVLREDRWIVAGAEEHEIYIEFAAVFLELRYFAANLLPICFPSLANLHITHEGAQVSGRARCEQLLARDIDAGKLFEDTRLTGAPDPVLLTDPSSDESHDYYWKLDRGAKASAASGNLVRAAILRTRAARVAPANLTRSTRGEAEADMNRLSMRLETALELTRSESIEWARDMCSLLDKADQGNRPVEADILFDLQKVVLVSEQGVYALSLVDWLMSGGRRPIKRLLPSQRQVRIIRHLRDALQRLTMARLSDNDRQHLAKLLQSAIHQSEERLRVRFRPILEVALQDVGLVPSNPPERTAFYTIIEELLDRIIAGGHLTFSELRDVISRNQLKLPDLGDPQDFLRGDPLLRLDTRLASLLDGVYRPSEMYSRFFERLTALNFGTHLGRLITTVVTLPFVSAFLLLRGVKLVIEFVDKDLLRLHPVETVSQKSSIIVSTIGQAAIPENLWTGWTTADAGVKARHQFPRLVDVVDPGLGLPPLINWALFALLGVYFVALWHSPHVRRRSSAFFVGLGRVLSLVLIQTPIKVARLPLLRRIAASWAFQFFYWFILKPLVVCLLLRFFRPELFTDSIGFGIIFLLLAFVINSKPGHVAGEIVVQTLMHLSEIVSVGLFRGLYNLIATLFKHLLSTVEGFLFSVDEWLRFRTGDNQVWMGARLLAGVVWFPIGYLIRFYIVVLVEPMLNPLKLPVSMIAGKLMSPFIWVLWFPWFLMVLPPLPLGSLLLWLVVAPTLFFLPDAFGYLFWELKENWGLYKANQSPVIRPVVVGSHGETMVMLLEPGLHSGTIPRLFARWRRAERKAVRTGNWRLARAYRLALQEVEHTLRLFVMRNLVALVHQSPTWKGHDLSVGKVALACSQIRIELVHALHPDRSVWLEFEEEGSWLVAKIQQTGWIADLPTAESRPFNAALVHLYKLAGVDLVREQIQAQLPPPMHDYDIKAREFVLWLDHRHGQSAQYLWSDDHGLLKPHISPAPMSLDLRNPLVVGPGQLKLEAPQLDAYRFMFCRVPLTWRQHVECWEKDKEGGEQPRLVSNGVELDLVGLARAHPTPLRQP
jgi:hypothetical protein